MVIWCRSGCTTRSNLSGCKISTLPLLFDSASIALACLCWKSLLIENKNRVLSYAVYNCPKFVSQMTKVCIILGKLLWLLSFVLFYMLDLSGKRSLKKIFLHRCLWQHLGVFMVGGMVRTTKQLQRLNSSSSKALAGPSLWTHSTCDTLSPGGFIFHLTCHLDFGKSQTLNTQVLILLLLLLGAEMFWG